MQALQVIVLVLAGIAEIPRSTHSRHVKAHQKAVSRAKDAGGLTSHILSHVFPVEVDIGRMSKKFAQMQKALDSRVDKVETLVENVVSLSPEVMEIQDQINSTLKSIATLKTTVEEHLSENEDRVSKTQDQISSMLQSIETLKTTMADHLSDGHSANCQVNEFGCDDDCPGSLRETRVWIRNITFAKEFASTPKVALAMQDLRMKRKFEPSIDDEGSLQEYGWSMRPENVTTTGFKVVFDLLHMKPEWMFGAYVACEKQR